MAATRSPASDSEIGTTQGPVCCVASSSIVSPATSTCLPSAAASTPSYSPSASCHSQTFRLAPIDDYFPGGHHIASLREFVSAGFITFTMDTEDAGEDEHKRKLWKAKILVGLKVGDAVEHLTPFEAVDTSKGAARDRASQHAANALRAASPLAENEGFKKAWMRRYPRPSPYVWKRGVKFPHEESMNVEFKDMTFNIKSMNEMVLKNICAFLNSDGGSIFFGVQDDRSIVGLAATEKQRDELLQAINQSFRHRLFPPLDSSQYNVSFHAVLDDGKCTNDLIVMELQVSKRTSEDEVYWCQLKSSGWVAYQRQPSTSALMHPRHIQQRLQAPIVRARQLIPQLSAALDTAKL
mmetsp:Transcript_7088/g.21668  ORF Transcript_7088/g.21668 Transcript_7088/m.21668 type:complete len:352 (+) Transcript_7088:94-1149(+)